jgi:hypothetical protein
MVVEEVEDGPVENSGGGRLGVAWMEVKIRACLQLREKRESEGWGMVVRSAWCIDSKGMVRGGRGCGRTN